MKIRHTPPGPECGPDRREAGPGDTRYRPLSVSGEPNALAERIKELNCLYGISSLFENQDASLPWIMQRAVELIPAAWQYPETACARIRLDGQEYVSGNFRQTRWSQTAEIQLNGSPVGTVDVCYLQAPPGGVDTPFLDEEWHLLRAIGERLGKVLMLKRSEEALRESEERYRILTEQVDEGVVLVQDNRFYYVNPAFCTLFNVPSADQIQQCPVDHPQAGEAGDIALLYGFVSRGSIASRIEDVHLFVRKDRSIWIQACHTSILFRGQPALLSTFKDITEIKEKQVAARREADLLITENRVLRSSLKDRYRLGDILGRSQAMQEVYERILKAAATDANVAVFGESGSGKELVATAIHTHSDRKNKRFVAVNCGAVQEPLFEREFFGHRRGSFSSAHADAPGYLDMADGGTLFLDEISELTVSMQAKLLRALEGGEYRPVGSADTVSADFRIISASNALLSDKVASGSMRTDFFYRIQVIQIHLPSLRDRKQDIPLLVEHFLSTMKNPSGITTLPGSTMDLLIGYDWPGNVRELRNVLQRYVTIGRLDLPCHEQLSQGSGPAASGLNLRDAVKELEADLIRRALQQTGGNRTRAATLLGISRRALFRKMEALI